MSTPTKTSVTAPQRDVATLRRNAREHIERGAVTDSYAGDRQAVLGQLNDALATELVCVLRYRRHHFMAKGLASKSVADEFITHANEELGHADLLAERIVQLGGKPDFAPASLAARSHSEYVEATSLIDMIKENLVAERIAIDSYRQLIDSIGNTDSTTRRMLETILGVEEEHADELADLLDGTPRLAK